MANIAAAMVGRGDVYYRGIRMQAAQALSRAGLTPIVLADFDEHALIDSGAFEIARTALLANDGSRQALEWADMIYAMDLDGRSASPAPLSLPAQANRPYQWLDWDAERILALLKGSYVFHDDPAGPPRVYPDGLASIADPPRRSVAGLGGAARRRSGGAQLVRPVAGFSCRPVAP